MTRTLVSFASSIFVSIYIIRSATRCDMFQYLHSPSTSYGYGETPPLHQQGRRVSITPSHPPHPPIDALPRPVPEVASQATLKHPLPEPAQQGPPNKQVRHKAFPHELHASSTPSMASPSAVDMSRMSAPSPKGPPASFMPTPGDVSHEPIDMSSSMSRGSMSYSLIHPWSHHSATQSCYRQYPMPEHIASFEDCNG